MNLENRIAEDEKLRNLSKKLVNSKSNDRTTKREAKASEKTIELHKFVFDDGNYAFLHVKMEHLYIDYADVLLQQERFDEVFSALENAYDHAKKFDDQYFIELYILQFSHNLVDIINLVI